VPHTTCKRVVSVGRLRAGWTGLHSARISDLLVDILDHRVRASNDILALEPWLAAQVGVAKAQRGSMIPCAILVPYSRAAAAEQYRG